MSTAGPTDAIAYERHGAGEPLVLIHGLGATRRIWGPQIEALAAERDVIALDMPGFGRSPELGPGTAPTAAAIGVEISRFCDSLGIERPHVAGNSLGGWVALEIAKAGKASSACLISPAGLWEKPLGPRKFDARRLGKRIRPLLLALARREGPRRRLLATVVGRPDRVPVTEAVAMIGGWIDAPGYTGANEQMRNHVFEGPERVEVPVTIGWGELDRLVGPPKAHRRPPGSELAVLGGCGHTPNWDDPGLVAELLLEASAGATAAASRAA